MERKIIKNSRDSYYVNIPKELMRELKWKGGQKVIFRQMGKLIVIEDWKKK